ASLKEIKVTMRIAGQVFEQTLNPLPNQKAEFIWDGLDHLGNTVTGLIYADVNIGFVYDGFFNTPRNITQAFAQAGTNATVIISRQEIISWKNNSIKISQAGGEAGTIAEGWTLSAHHSWFQYSGNILYKGDGKTISNNAAIITTVAGNGQGGFSGDGGPAVEAMLSDPRCIVVDSIGNMYIADTDNNHRIRKVDTSGIITTVAGNGQIIYSGDGGPASEAGLRFPYGVAVDSIGNVYIADTGNQRIRKVDTSGIITTVAGNGQYGYSGDGGPASEAELYEPIGMSVDSIGNIYVSDSGNHRIRKVDTSGIITTVAGSGQYGYSGDDGPATEAELYWPRDVAVDSIGNIYIADTDNGRIRKVDTSGIITTVAGNGQSIYSGDDGPATEAGLGSPHGVAVDSTGNIFIADLFTGIRKVDTSGIITTVAGNGQIGFSGGDGGPATEAQLFFPNRVAVDSIGDIYITEGPVSKIRKVSFPEEFVGPVSAGEMAFTDENGLGYIMDSTGLHKSTIDLSTGKTLLTFGYNGDSQLESITDRFGNQTTIQRDASGVPISITSPDGIVTGLTVDGNNHLTQVTYPDSNFSFTYDPGG
ncbi:MAG: hypothetical protein GY774_38325, partial [Planctomycetes bacterium]|nr:hypothetical protein [Planctomycetota bacterium]